MIRKIALAVSMFSLLFLSCSRSLEESKSLHVGINKTINAAPIVLASHFNLFKKEGLDIAVDIVESSQLLMDGLFSKKYDVVSISDYRAVVNSYSNDDFRIIAVLNRNQSRILVMNSQVLTRSADLAGKRIGIDTNSAANYTLYRLLLFNNISENDVIIKHFDINKLPQALQKGEVDAIITWEPFTSKSITLFEKHMTIENCHMGRDMYWLLVTRPDIIESKNNVFSNFFLVLEKTNGLLKKNPQHCFKTIEPTISFSSNPLLTSLNTFTFRLELPQSLLISLEQQAAWYKRHMDTEPLFFDFLTLVDTEPLSQQFENRVSIITIGEPDAH
ncbi:MAG TPA: ABC transporter substrate-binding protein [Treponemataceae bacterium]|nr:ABC transporter substrate-binding protein [Treponemataceae bacterium]